MTEALEIMLGEAAAMPRRHTLFDEAIALLVRVCRLNLEGS